MIFLNLFMLGYSSNLMNGINAVLKLSTFILVIQVIVHL